MAEKPLNQKEMVEELWRQVCGNGELGLIDRFDDHVKDDAQQSRDMTTALQALTVTVEGIAGRLGGHMDTSRPTTKQITKRRLLEILIGTGVVSIVLGAFVLIAIGRLDAEDIAQILQALPGGGN